MKRLVMISVMMITMFGLAGEALAVKAVNKTADNIPEDVKFLIARDAWAARQAKKAANPSVEIPTLPSEDALAVQTAQKTADNPPVDNPFVRITTTPDKLNLGIARFPGTHESSSELTVNVDSNYMYGSITASISPLKRDGGGYIEPESIFIKGPATNGYVTMNRPVPVSKPSGGSKKIALNFKVETEFKDPAGRYEGILMFTVVPPS